MVGCGRGTERRQGPDSGGGSAQDPCPARPGTHRPCMPCLSGAAFQPEQASTCAALRPATLGGTLSQRLRCAAIECYTAAAAPATLLAGRKRVALTGRGSWGAPEAQAGLAATRGLSASNQRQQTRPKRAGRWRWGQRPQRASYRPRLNAACWLSQLAATLVSLQQESTSIKQEGPGRAEPSSEAAAAESGGRECAVFCR